MIDTDTFKLLANIDAGRSPTRVVVQPDGKYLWVGNDAQVADGSGVTVIDTETLKPVKSLDGHRAPRDRGVRGQPRRLRHQPRSGR